MQDLKSFKLVQLYVEGTMIPLPCSTALTSVQTVIRYLLL